MKNKLPILICFGTRPEWLKVKPLIKLMNRDEYQLLFTGQHEDLLKSVEVDYKITINNSVLNGKFWLWQRNMNQCLRSLQ